MHLNRLTTILEIVGQKGHATVADICAHSDLPKPTAYRLVQDLTAAGLLDQPGRGAFAIGARLRRIANPAHSDAALLDVIAPMLARAANEHGAAFFVSRLRGHGVEIIHVETPATGVSYLHPGIGKRPIHACSCSKAIAAVSPGFLDHADLRGRLKAYTENTVTDFNALEAEFDVIRRQGYAECVEELERGMCSVAATLSASGPGAAVSIGATASSRVFTRPARRQIGQELRRMAQRLAGTLGWAEAADREKSA